MEDPELMNCTLTLPVPLWRRTKAFAAQEGLKLREVVITALESHVPRSVTISAPVAVGRATKPKAAKKRRAK